MATNKEVKYLLSLGNVVDTNWMDENGSSLLYQAADGGYDDVFYHILQRPNTNANTTNKLSRTPLAAAAFGRHKDVVEELLDHGVDVNLRDMDGRTGLPLAAYQGYYFVVYMLLDHQELKRDTEDNEVMHHYLLPLTKTIGL